MTTKNTDTTRRRPKAMADTVGIDLGDKSHEACILKKSGKVRSTTTLLNCRSELEAFSAENKGAAIILEAGTIVSQVAH